MTAENRISVVINTYNAERYLSQVLKSVKHFDEVVVCDMESSDSTVETAKAKGCRVVTFPKGNYNICEPARDFAVHSATFPWVLVVDADEIVTKQLRTYLYTRIQDSNCPDALYIPRRNLFMGRYLRDSPDYQLRFFRRDKCYWPPVIHCIPKIEGSIEFIPKSIDGIYLLHLDDACISEMITKLNRYTDNEVEKRRHKRYNTVTMLIRPLWFFMRSLVLQGGIIEGKRGIIRAYMKGIYQIVLLSKITEQKYRDGENKIKR